jgi:hypothetical protein
VLGTSSSEAALPSLLQKMERAGASKSVVGLVVPTGYSFNLDGTNIYMTMAALFIAQATGVGLGAVQVAAQGVGGVLGLLLRPDEDGAAPTAALTRWRSGAAPSDSASPHAVGDAAWNLDLLRCRGGRPATWRATWHGDQLVTEDGTGTARTRRRA